MRTRREHVGEGGAGVAALLGVEVPCGGIRFDVGCALWSTSGIWMDGCTQGHGCTLRRHPFSLRTMHPLEYVGEPLGACLKHLQAPAHREREEPLPVPLRRVVRVCWVRVCMSMVWVERTVVDRPAACVVAHPNGLRPPTQKQNMCTCTHNRSPGAWRRACRASPPCTGAWSSWPGTGCRPARPASGPLVFFGYECVCVSKVVPSVFGLPR